MRQSPNNRALKSGDTLTRKRAVIGRDTVRQAYRACATVADVLGRDPQEKDFVTGSTGLICSKSKIVNRKS
jgi:hypothetical protein